jgi:hypothetical protein
MNEGSALTWREVVEKHHSALVDELSDRLDSDLRDAVSRTIAEEHSKAGSQIRKACDDARRSQAESLNQVLRRLRATGEEQILQLAAECCSSYAEQLVVLVFEDNQARYAAGIGIAATGDDGTPLSFDISSAPAIVAAIESRDPVTSLGADAEISPVLAKSFSQTFETTQDRKAYLFPVVTRHSVVAMLIAPGIRASAPIELICEAAGMRLEALLPAGLSARQPDAADLIQSAPAVPASATPAVRPWDGLTTEDQKLHLQAQRMARVRVAEMRLYHESEIRSGAASGNIYGCLQREIDAARDQFLQTFLSKSPTMVDYIHLEILRSLAHDDDRLLGNSYPGPMV